MHVIRAAGIALFAVLVAASPALAVEQATPSCPDYHGITCDGWVTDAAGVLTDETAVEAAAGRLVAAHDHEVAVVVAADSDGLDPHDFAAGLGDAWGVGDPARNDGIVVLVSLAERRTEIVTGDGLTIDGLDSVAEAGNAYFADGDFSGGLIAIITTLDARLSGVPAGGGESDGGGTGIFRLVVAGGIMASGLYLVGGTRRRQAARVRSARTAKVDDALDELEPAGEDLPTISEYALARPGGKGDIATKAEVAALRDLADGRVPGDDDALKGLWRWGLVEVVDKKKLLADAAEPLELKVSQEREMLESGVQAAVKDALGVGRSAEDLFKVRLDELESLVQALRPHRIAEARRHTAETLADALTETPIGAVGVTDLGTRLVEVAPALEGDQPVTDSITEMDGAFHTAEEKADRLATLYGRLDESVARPAVAAALADLDDDLDGAVERYEKLRRYLEEHGDVLTRDGLEVSAIAALLLMNHDDQNASQFLKTYRARRQQGADPSEAVEYALAGLRDPDEIRRVRELALQLGLPVAITVALMRRRDDGVEVYRQILEQLSSHGVKGETRRTIAGVLAMSLEPSRAVDRWVEALAALQELGLTGAYAEVAAAFGASDARGPKAFALAYAAQRRALDRADLKDAERFAP
ncbi:MAG TPA: TPM domain-containing protein, partial [Acidimicrobiia bacterium]